MHLTSPQAPRPHAYHDNPCSILVKSDAVRSAWAIPDKPLIYNIAWKTVIYLLVSAFIHYLERLFDFWREAGGLVAASEKQLAVMIWPHFWAIQLILFLLIASYCTMHELVRVIGKEKVMRIFFSSACSSSNHKQT